MNLNLVNSISVSWKNRQRHFMTERMHTASYSSAVLAAAVSGAEVAHAGGGDGEGGILP